MLACAYHPSYVGSIKKKNVVQASLGKPEESIPKITKAD
jgi:hypothetical protein